MLREELKEHEQLECPMYCVPCQFNNFGCEAQLKRAEIDEHSENNVETHVRLLTQTLESMREEMRSLVREDEKMQIQIKALMKKMKAFENNSNHN